MQVSIEIPADAEAAAVAREFIAGALAVGFLQHRQHRLEDVGLLTSEVVTNSVRHAGLAPGDTIGLAVDVSERRIRVEVADDGPGFDPLDLPESSPEGVGGWGLRIVNQLSDRWGVIRDEPNHVWFEVSL